MALEAEETVGEGIIALFLKQGHGEELAAGLAHLAVAGVQVVNMHPEIAPMMAEIGLGLGDFVSVVGESVIDAAAVDIKVFAEVLHGNAGALNVPAGIADAPGGIPFQCLILELGLGEPEDKVVLIALVGVLIDALAHTDSEIVLIEVVENIVALKLGGIEVHIAAGEVGIAGVKELGDDADIVIDAVGRGLDNVGALDVELLAVREESVGIELCDLHDALVLALCALEHLVLTLVGVGGQVANIGYVHDALDVIAEVAQILFKNVLHDVGTEVADVGKVIDRGAAGVHLDDVGMVGDKLVLGSGSGII